MTTREPFDVPEQVMVDTVTGYAINLPLGPQDYPGWQDDRPDVVERIRRLRHELEVSVRDDEFRDPPHAGTQTESHDRSKRPLSGRRRVERRPRPGNVEM